MEHLSPASSAWLAGTLFVWLVFGAGVYFSLARFVAGDGGKVNVGEFGQPDFLLCAGFMGWFAMVIASGVNGPEHQVTRSDLVEGAVLYLGIMALIAGFLNYRGINPLRQFGVLRRNPLLCIALAAGLLLCACPLLMVAARLTEIALNGKARPQNIVEFFMNASEASDRGSIYLTMLTAVVVAPAAEETIFRGYIYGVLKRYVGGLPAAVVSAALFAALHMNLSSLGLLFVLALCLTLAYEATGSLLVNIFMHGLFNLSMLLAMLQLSRHPASP